MSLLDDDYVANAKKHGPGGQAESVSIFCSIFHVAPALVYVGMNEVS
jgi:hypothetical protein